MTNKQNIAIAIFIGASFSGAAFAISPDVTVSIHGIGRSSVGELWGKSPSGEPIRLRTVATINTSNNYVSGGAYTESEYGHLIVSSISEYAYIPGVGSMYSSSTALASWRDWATISDPTLNGQGGYFSFSIATTSNTANNYLPRVDFNYSIDYLTSSSHASYSNYSGIPGIITGTAYFVFGQPFSIYVSSAAQTEGAYGYDYSSNVESYWGGINQITLTDGAQIDKSGLSFTSLAGVNWSTSYIPVGATPQAPQLPGNDGSMPLPDRVNNDSTLTDPSGNIFQPTFSRNRFGFFDPEIAIGYNFQASGSALFMGVKIPYAYGDGIFDLWLFNPITGEYYDTGTDIKTGEYFDFGQIGMKDGVAIFSLRGIETEAMIDPEDPEGFVTGISWSGEGEFTMTPITASVPEPHTYGMMLVGLSLVGIATRRPRFRSFTPSRY